MKKPVLIIIGIIFVIIIIPIIWYTSTYNSIVVLETKVDTEYSNISVQLERRADLIPNLINTVKGYMAHEDKIITEITNARERMIGASNISEMSEANKQLTQALNKLNVVVENYPDLKSNQNFMLLQDEIAGTENRIATARRDYNNAVNSYNVKIKTMPSALVASIMGKESKELFEVTDESKKEVPIVEF